MSYMAKTITFRPPSDLLRRLEENKKLGISYSFQINKALRGRK